jgi:predicted transcriptional regulator
MKSILIQLDDQTYRLLERVAPAAKRRRAQFVRKALLKAVMEAEETRTRAAYRAKPDSEREADDWSTAEEFRA